GGGRGRRSRGVLRRRPGGGGGPEGRVGATVPRSGRSLRVLTTVPPSDRGGGRPDRGRHHRFGNAHLVRGPRLPQAGTLDGRARATPAAGSARSWRGVRLPRGSREASPGLDAGPRPR